LREANIWVITAATSSSFDTHDRGDGVAGEIVVGRSETTAHDHCVGVVQGAAQHGFDATEVVADLHLHQRVDAVARKVLADPGAVGVDDLAEQQLRSDSDDVTTHWRPLSADGPATCTGNR